MTPPSIIKAGVQQKAAGVFGLLPDDTYFLTPDSEGVRLPVHVVAHGKADGEGLVIKANARAIVRSVPLRPSKYTFLVSFNPALLKTALVSCPAVVGKKDLADGLSLGILGLAATDLAAVDWVFEVRAIS